MDERCGEVTRKEDNSIPGCGGLTLGKKSAMERTEVTPEERDGMEGSTKASVWRMEVEMHMPRHELGMSLT